VFCVSVKVKLTVSLLCVCVLSAWKGRPQNDLYCVGWVVKPYLLTHSLTHLTIDQYNMLSGNAVNRCLMIMHACAARHVAIWSTCSHIMLGGSDRRSIGVDEWSQLLWHHVQSRCRRHV